jgi:hypothetical protein
MKKSWIVYLTKKLQLWYTTDAWTDGVLSTIMTKIAAEIKISGEDPVCHAKNGTRMNVMAEVTHLVQAKTITEISGTVIPISRKNILKIILMTVMIICGEIMKIVILTMLITDVKRLMIITIPVIMFIARAGDLAV